MKNRRWITLSAIAGLTFALAACDKSESGGGSGGAKLPGADQMKAAAGNAQKMASDAASSMQSAFTQTVSGLQTQYEKIKAEAAKFTDPKLNEMTASIQSKLSNVQASIAKMKDANQDALKSIQTEVAAALDQIKSLCDQAMSRLAELKAKPPM